MFNPAVYTVPQMSVLPPSLGDCGCGCKGAGSCNSNQGLGAFDFSGTLGNITDFLQRPLFMGIPAWVLLAGAGALYFALGRKEKSAYAQEVGEAKRQYRERVQAAKRKYKRRASEWLERVDNPRSTSNNVTFKRIKLAATR